MMMNMKIKLLKYSVMAIFLCCFATLSAGQGNTSEGSLSGKTRYLDRIFDHLIIHSDIIFTESVNENGVSQKHRLDVYMPEGDVETARPVIMWIHGGGFTFGNDKTQRYIVEMASRFARMGYVGVSVDYRLRAKPRENFTSTVSEAVEDALKGLDWIRKNSESLRIDPEKIIVAGGSAGGMIAVTLCINDMSGSVRHNKSGIRALVNLWGSPAMESIPLDVDPGDPPAVIVHGTEDALVPLVNSEKLAAALGMKNVPHEFVVIPGAGHTPVAHMDDFCGKIAAFLLEWIR